MAGTGLTPIRFSLPVAALAAALAISSAAPSAEAAAAAGASNAELAGQVRQAEIAFARTMADRDHQAFARHVAEEAIFFGGETVLRGRGAVADGWARFFEGAEAPFSWAPERVEVLDSGTLALSTGPVFDPGGKRVGTFISTWRREQDGVWRVVFDRGCPPCASPAGP
jgi:ketosteroid isomerase-like protein